MPTFRVPIRNSKQWRQTPMTNTRVHIPIIQQTGPTSTFISVSIKFSGANTMSHPPKAPHLNWGGEALYLSKR